MKFIKTKGIVLTLLVFMQLAVASQGVTYFRVTSGDGVPHLPVFANEAAVPVAARIPGAIIYSTALDRPRICTAAIPTWADLDAANAAEANAGYFQIVNGVPIIPIQAGDPGLAPSGSIYFQNGGILRVCDAVGGWQALNNIANLTIQTDFSTGSNVLDVFQIPVLSSSPYGETGGIYFNSQDNQFCYCQNNGWWKRLIPETPAAGAFVTRWNMTAANFTLRVQPGTYTDVTIDWGCDDAGHVTGPYTGVDPGSFTHDYSQGSCGITGTESIDIEITTAAAGVGFPGIKLLGGATDAEKLTKVIQWGNVGWKNFYQAFFDAKNLRTLPEGTIPITGANNTTALKFARMFWDCQSLEQIPRGIFDAATATTDFNYMVLNGSSMLEIPENLFDFNVNVTSFHAIFYNCSNIRAIPAGLFDNCPLVTDFAEVFFGNTTITTIPAGLFANNNNVTSFQMAFKNCNKITTIPGDIFGTTAANVDFTQAFLKCSSLTAIPEGLFDNCPNAQKFSQTFSDCNGLITEIPADLFTLAKFASINNFSQCFAGCAIPGLTNAPALWDQWNAATGIVTTNCFTGAGPFANNAAIIAAGDWADNSWGIPLP